ncbi:hypothetical protein TSACC_2975 [Terrimicrobium sacchariphilum]|uniref:Carbohydrate family 9 binding domain-like n=1 Tax=Terrimicrobium sacchariphilum TaxID=690879 RepID=A0A146G7C7_TERSA|nr:hypothetical protein [Terrimicrobium sacchariphilum]GAT32576.1 hypothetical protein TSACC_2975 [Terrimicrobium sacchariphilum]
MTKLPHFLATAACGLIPLVLHAADPAESIPRSKPAEALPDAADLVAWPLSPYPVIASDSVANAAAWLLDAPAGKHGFVHTRPDGQLEFQDGTPVRFWGTTTVFGMTLPDTAEDIGRLADSIASAGYNMVRFHHNDIPRRGLGYLQEDPKSNSLLQPNEMDKLDRFASELYKRGVYVYLDFADFRPFLPEDGMDDGEAMNQLENRGWKGVFPHPKIVEAWERAVTEFLSHVNPYTGRKWGEEPGVGTVEIINENGLFWDWNFKVTDGVRAWHQQEWNNWLLARYRNRETLDAQWTDAAGTKGLFADEDPAKGNVFAPKLGRYLEWDRPYRSKTKGSSRVNDWYAFLADQATGFYREAAKHIRSLGFQGVIVGSHELQGPINQYAEVQGTGTIAAHLYAHGGLLAWDARPGVRGVVMDGVDASTSNWFSNLPRIKVRGAPGINGEWTGRSLTMSADCNLAIAAITAQQKVTQSLHFSFGHRWVGEPVPDYDFSYKWQEYKKAITFNYSSMHDVPWMAVNRICAALFIRRDFQKNKAKADIAFSSADLREQNLHALGLSGGGGTIGDAALFLPILHEVECVFFDDVYEGDADVVFMTGRTASGDYRKAKHAVLVGDNPYTDPHHKSRDLGLPARTVRPEARIVNLTTPTTFTVSWPWPESRQLTFDALEGAVEAASIPEGAKPIGLSADGKYTLGWLDDRYLVLPNGRAFQEKIADVQWLYRLYLAACQRWKIDTADNAPGKSFIQSDTRELTIDWGHGTTIVDTERTQGFSGLMGWREKNTTKNLEAAIDLPYGNVLATSTDGQPLGDSRRILLVAAARMQNTGQVLGLDAKGFPNYTSTGKAPALIEALRGRVSLASSLAPKLKVYALDVEGRRLGEVPATVQAGKLTFDLSPKWGTLWFEIATADIKGPAAPDKTVWPLAEKPRAASPKPEMIALADYYRLVNRSLDRDKPTDTKAAQPIASTIDGAVFQALPQGGAPASSQISIPFVPKGTVTADGKPDEPLWKAALNIDMNEDKIPEWHFFGTHIVEGRRLHDEGGRFWFVATDEGLAVTAYIRKGEPGVVMEKPDWFQNDCLEILIDADGKGGKPDKQLFLAYRTPKTDQASASDPSIQIGRAADERGYLLEALIPWQALGFTGRPTGEFGLEMQIDFARRGLGRALQMVYGTGTNEAFIQSENYLKARIAP